MQPLSAPQESAPQGSVSAAASRRLTAVLAGVAGLALLTGAVGLWGKYGTAVFFEIMAAGLRACF
ncbi:MAG: hypothetical protein EKK32_09905 [Bradyrhizobiaceae bacterium]|nr:hypothetical protein BBta_0786 [Bradyrhizobium sp. BTAi1]RTM02944.1 MAG: hypothetical protein EKK32_09905 [Bradyrhizobiaceae bacterium]